MSRNWYFYKWNLMWFWLVSDSLVHRGMYNRLTTLVKFWGNGSTVRRLKRLIYDRIVKSVLEFRIIKYEKSNLTNLIFTASVACKNQFRNCFEMKLIFWFLNLIFQNWKKKSSETRYFKNQVEIDRGLLPDPGQHLQYLL